jgi:tetratricopeptide (TPR) repeat protein
LRPAPAIEQDYVNALAARYSGEAKPDYKVLAKNYAAQMRSLSQKYPEDLDAATLYAESLMNLNPWKLWSLDGAPAEDTTDLESVLSREPMHVVEASRSPERALPSAARLEAMVPKAGHLVHMPSHIYSRVGNFADAARSNAKAIAADRSYAAEAERSGSLYDLMYHSHNEHFLAFAASMQGRYAEAKKAADEMSKRLLPHADMMPMLDSFVWTPIWVDLRFSKWKEILARPEPAASRKVPHLMWRYSGVLAYASQRQTVKAETEQAAFLTEAASLPAEAVIGQMNPNDAMLSVATAIASAKMDAAKGDSESAIKHWRAAAEAQDKLNYTEPPDWYYPVRESLGAALLSAGKLKEAVAAFREDLLKNPRNPRSLFGLKECLAAQHAESDAAWVERQFREAWKDADAQLKIGDL